MEDKVKEAVDYAVVSNKIENNTLTESEVKTVLEGMSHEDESFLYSVVDLIKNSRDDEKKDDSDGEVRKRLI